MSEMVKRVARAIWYDRNPDRRWTEREKADYEGHARAAIEAMAVPTRKMELAAECSDSETASLAWQAMIDEALK